MTETAKRTKYLKQKYDITSTQWEKIFDHQKGKCPICLKRILKPGNPEGKRAAAVDHDHVTKRVRGLTCYRCNRFTIGRNRDTSKLKRLIAYLDSTFDGREI